MPILTQSEARLRQPPGLEASPKDGQTNYPRRVIEFPENNVVVAKYEKAGSPSQIYFPNDGINQLQVLVFAIAKANGVLPAQN